MLYNRQKWESFDSISEKGMRPKMIKIPLKCPWASVLINEHEVSTIVIPQANLEEILYKIFEFFYDILVYFALELLTVSLYHSN